MKETLNPADRLRSHSCNEPKGYIFDYGGTLDTCGNHWCYGMATSAMTFL